MFAQHLADPGEKTSSKIYDLSKKLRWADPDAHERYDATKDNSTNQLLGVIDDFVSDRFHSAEHPEEVKSALDSALHDFNPGYLGNVAFSAELPRGRFLVVGLDLMRLAGAVMDDAISFRAYGLSNGGLTLISNTGGDMDGRVLRSVVVLPNASGSSECRFLALFGWPSIGSPFSLRARLYAFDGLQFHTLWTSQEFKTYDVASALRTTSSGFTLRRFDTERSPDWPLMQDEYIQTLDGVERSGSVRVELGAY